MQVIADEIRQEHDVTKPHGHNPPQLGRVNVCNHFARNCDCIRWYSHICAFSVHAHYYFRLDDWDNIFSKTDKIRVVSHLANELEVSVPEVHPEFKWQRKEDAKVPFLERGG